MLLGGDECILTCCNWYFEPISGRFQQGVGGSFEWYLQVFAIGVGWVQKCGYGGDYCGCQNLESSSNDLLFCGYCDCHKHLGQKMIL